MKIRVQGNSIRLRLSQTDVKEFGRHKVLTEVVRFPDGNEMKYEITQISQGEISANFYRGRITVAIPETDAEKWVGTDQVGMSRHVALDSGEKLEILIEKDYQCLHPRIGEDESDAFPNPGTVNQ